MSVSWHNSLGGKAKPSAVHSGADSFFRLSPATLVSPRARFRYELCRLSTFAACGQLGVSALSLAATGFYYDVDRDDIVCFSCGVSKRRWGPEDRPVDTVHSALATAAGTPCPLASGTDRTNVPVNPGLGASHGGKAADEAVDAVSGYDDKAGSVCSHAEGEEGAKVQHEEGSPAQDVISTTLTGASAASAWPDHLYQSSALGAQAAHGKPDLNALADLDTDGPESSLPAAGDVVSPEGGSMGSLDLAQAVSPTHAAARVRMASFTDWPSGQLPDARTMASAGFFSLGTGDTVMCFYCGTRSCSWRAGDDPWRIHVLLRFSCAYVAAVKGQRYIYTTQAELARERLNPYIRDGLMASAACNQSDTCDGAVSCRSLAVGQSLAMDGPTPSVTAAKMVTLQTTTGHATATQDSGFQLLASGTSLVPLNPLGAATSPSAESTSAGAKRNFADVPQILITNTISRALSYSPLKPRPVLATPPSMSSPRATPTARHDDSRNQNTVSGFPAAQELDTEDAPAARSQTIERSTGSFRSVDTTDSSSPRETSNVDPNSSKAASQGKRRADGKERERRASETASGVKQSSASAAAGSKWVDSQLLTEEVLQTDSDAATTGHSSLPSAGRSSKPSTGYSSMPSTGYSSLPSVGYSSSTSSVGYSSMTSAGQSSQFSAGYSSTPSVGYSSLRSPSTSPMPTTAFSSMPAVRRPSLPPAPSPEMRQDRKPGCPADRDPSPPDASPLADDSLQALHETNMRLRQMQNCRLCGASVQVLFLPCGHLCTCEMCAGTIERCCLCQTGIKATARVYME